MRSRSSLRIGRVFTAGLAVLALALATQTPWAGTQAGKPPVVQDKVVNTATTTCGAMAKYAPKCGALWGVYTLQDGNPEQSIRRLESKVGRKFDLTSRFHDFSDSLTQGQFPDVYERRVGPGSRLFISWQARVSSTNKDLQWRAIANGSYDRFVNSAATRVKAYGQPVFIAFDAEFDTNPNKGTPADYVAAYRHVFNVFKAKGVTNVAWAWVTSGYTGAGNGAKILQGYPGDAYVDWVGYDPYNFYRCNGTGWKTFGEKVTPTYNWLISHGLGKKPFLLSEYGTQYDTANPARSKAWHSGIPAALKNLPNLKALIRFDANGYFGSKKCNFYIKNGGTASLNDFAAGGRGVKAALQP
jgi:glycosyl hydrolase family 26